MIQQILAGIFAFISGLIYATQVVVTFPLYLVSVLRQLRQRKDMRIATRKLTSAMEDHFGEGKVTMQPIAVLRTPWGMPIIYMPQNPRTATVWNTDPDRIEKYDKLLREAHARS